MKSGRNILLMNLLLGLTIILPACTKEDKHTAKIKPVQNYGDPFYQERIVLPKNQKDTFTTKKPGIERIDNRHLNLEK